MNVSPTLQLNGCGKHVSALAEAFVRFMCCEALCHALRTKLQLSVPAEYVWFWKCSAGHPHCKNGSHKVLFLKNLHVCFSSCIQEIPNRAHATVTERCLRAGRSTADKTSVQQKVSLQSWDMHLLLHHACTGAIWCLHCNALGH